MRRLGWAMAVTAAAVALLAPASGAMSLAGSPGGPVPATTPVAQAIPGGTCYVSAPTCSLHPCTELIGSASAVATTVVGTGVYVAPVVSAPQTPRPTLTCSGRRSGGGAPQVATVVPPAPTSPVGGNLTGILSTLQHKLSARPPGGP
jgi:hypothetical protein